MYLVDCSSLSICVGNSGCLETQAGMVGRSLRGLTFCCRYVETGMWSDVVDLCVRGSHRVFVWGVWSWRADANMFV